jgi:tRNA G18 (ribose-2'-O)-methylase SpoU
MSTATVGWDPSLVDSPQHPLAQLIRQLLRHPQRQARRRAILIDDEENILQALRAGVRLERLFYAGGEAPSERLRRALPEGVTVHEVSLGVCKKLFENDKLSRLFAVARLSRRLELGDLAGQERDVVVLDGLGIAGNIGAIIRTCVAFGVGGVVLLNADSLDIYDRRLIRASRGHVFSLPVVKASTGQLLDFCRRQGWPLLVTSPRARQEVRQVAALPRPLAIVFGNEIEGCSRALVEAARLQVRIPTAEPVESLNVSAAAITLYSRLGE